MNIPLEIEVSRQDTGRGFITVLKRAGRETSVYNSTALSNDPNFGSIINPVDSAYTAMVEGIAEHNLNGHVANALEFEINRRFALFQPIMLNSIQGVKQRRINLDVRKARVAELNRDVEPNAHLRSDYRRFFQSHPHPQRIELALTSDHTFAAAIFEGGQAMAGLDDAVWSEFQDRWLALNHVKRSGLEADFTVKSSPEFITGAGVDADAAYRFAVELVKGLDRESELLELAESYFKSLVAALVLLTNKPASEIIGLGA